LSGSSGTRVPADVSVTLEFDGGATAGFYCSFAAADQQWLQVSGTRAGLRVSDFVLPYDGRKVQFDVVQSEFVVRGCDFRMKPGVRTVVIDEAPTRDPGAQESRMFRSFSEQVLSGQINPEWPRIALETQETVDACQAAILAEAAPV